MKLRVQQKWSVHANGGQTIGLVSLYQCRCTFFHHSDSVMQGTANISEGGGFRTSGQPGFAKPKIFLYTSSAPTDVAFRLEITVSTHHHPYCSFFFVPTTYSMAYATLRGKTGHMWPPPPPPPLSISNRRPWPLRGQDWCTATNLLALTAGRQNKAKATYFAKANFLTLLFPFLLCNSS